jgi:hypothetical protein
MEDDHSLFVSSDSFGRRDILAYQISKRTILRSIDRNPYSSLSYKAVVPHFPQVNTVHTPCCVNSKKEEIYNQSDLIKNIIADILGGEKGWKTPRAFAVNNTRGYVT